ncbi:MAG: Cof-type HAD-IIB family hydrolase [Planctomycetota bacterium]|nr:Cof-type HAD-IIB family hydrolase [Planctomycetota bacterium]
MDRSVTSSRRIPPSASADTSARIRLVAIDLDGTLLNDKKEISRQTAAALHSLPASGIKVIIASARPPRSVRQIYRQLRLDTWQINYNGALIWDEPANRAIFHQPMPGALARAIIDLARAQSDAFLASCEILDKWFTDRVDPRHTTETSRLFQPDVIAPLDQFCDQPITKVLLQGEPSAIDELESVLTRDFTGKISIVRTEPVLLQITDKNVSKAAALKMVARHYNVPLQQTLAIGDAPNDLEMLQLAGVAIAMDNAHPSIKQAAHWIAPSNNDHGVHAALVKYGLAS